ncbi:hypothetical protein DFS33DRAFT_1234971, partial [Desarmillaria ectypa]
RLTEKWDPRRIDKAEGTGLSQEERDRNQIARGESGVIRFDPAMDNADSLTDGIRIFTSSWDTYSRPATTHSEPERDPMVAVAYTDGSAYDNGTAEACTGAGVWFGEDSDRNIFLRLPGPHQTNNAEEIRAI